MLTVVFLQGRWLKMVLAGAFCYTAGLVTQGEAMCRVFGFKSVLSSGVHNSLVEADNALASQSSQHPHGWGVAYYVAGSPHVIKSVNSALEDKIFKRVSGVVSSHTVVAHIRKATLGGHSLLNTHPFQYGPWVFAHNGHIHEFDKYRDALAGLISPQLKSFVLGQTDSELLFYIILTEYYEEKTLADSCSVEELSEIIKKALKKITKVIGLTATVDSQGLEHNYLSFIMTNGNVILAHQGGKKVFYSTYKKLCADRGHCPSFADNCEAPSQDGFVNHMLFSSEPLSGENIWLEMKPGEMMGVDDSMKVFQVG